MKFRIKNCSARKPAEHRYNQPLCRSTCVLSVILFSIAGSVTAVSAQSVPLTGGIEHSEKLGPVSDELKPGKSVEDKAFKAKSAGDEWFSLPGWLCGTWRTIQLIRTFRYDDQSGNSDTKPVIESGREREVFGYQQDKLHNYWTCARTIEPIISQSDTTLKDADGKEITNSVETYKFRKNQEVSISADKVVLKTIDTVVSVNSQKQIVGEIEQRESIRTFVLIDSDLVSVFSDVQTYDRRGYPKIRIKQAEYRTRESQFKVKDLINGVSLYASFKDSLQKSHQLNLDPGKERDE